MGLSLQDFLGPEPEVPSSLTPVSLIREELEAMGPEGAAVDMGAPSEPPASSVPWSLPIERLSASSLNMLAVCPRQFQQRYLFRRKDRPTQAQVVGNSFHSTMEHNFRQKQVTHDDLPIEDVVDFFHDEAWPQAIEDAGGEDEVAWWEQQDARISGAVMVTSYRRDVSPTIQPLEVEHQFSILVPDVGVPLVGQIDVIDSETIIDLKTSKRRVNKMKPTWRSQGRIYQLATPRNTAFHVVTLKGEILEPLVIPYTMTQWLETEAWVRNLAMMAEFYWTTYGMDQDWPTLGTIHDWRCDWCGYREDCPAWRK